LDQAQQQAQPRPPQLEGGRNEERGPNKLTLALKWFFLAMAVGLIFSIFLGIYMAFKFNRSQALVWGMLFLGTAIPLALIHMMDDSKLREESGHCGVRINGR
jgi:Kef-type K+ transport system membrane component KefB